jgi:hypothetical protein
MIRFLGMRQLTMSQQTGATPGSKASALGLYALPDIAGAGMLHSAMIRSATARATPLLMM